MGVLECVSAYDPVLWALVLATGAESVNELVLKVKDMVPEVYVIGDAARPGKIMAAVEQAADLARKL